MTSIQYKDLTGNTYTPKEVSYHFTGYEIKKEHEKLSYITEYLNGEVLGTISFRPTKIPVIFSINYGQYREERYNHGGVRVIYLTNQDARLFGEYRRFSSTGELIEVRYYMDSTEVTTDIMNFVNFGGSNEEFNDYQFGEDEHFNICMKYGAYFKFINEYDYNPQRFNDIVAYCLQ